MLRIEDAPQAPRCTHLNTGIARRTPHPRHVWSAHLIRPMRSTPMIQLRRHGTLVRALVLALIAALAIPFSAALSATTAQAHPGHGADTFNALIFSKTAAFRHDSIPA